MNAGKPIESALQRALPGFRWFGAKARAIRRVMVVDRLPFPEAGPAVEFLLCRVLFGKGAAETYLVPVDLATVSPWAPLGKDPVDDSAFARALLARVFSGASTAAGNGKLAASWRIRKSCRARPCVEPSAKTASGEQRPYVKMPSDPIPTPHRLKGEQSNTSIRFGQSYMLKLLRRLEEGVNPEVEIGRHLSRGKGFAYAPRLLGTLDYVRAGRAPLPLCCVHEFVPARGDAWTAFLGELRRWRRGRISEVARDLRARASQCASPIASARARRSRATDSVRRAMTPFTRWAALLGRRTGSLHAALARGRRSPDFAPEPLTAAMRAKLARKLARQAADTVAMIGKVRNRLPVAQREAVDRLAGLPSRVHPILSALRRTPIAAQIARTHGDYHLGQVLFTGKDFAIIDFEGEPARSLADRRAKHSPLRDVAGMLRSFHYAACMGLAAAGSVVAERWCDAVSAAFLRGYRATAPKSVLPKNERDFRLLLDVYLLEKALYELRYEMNNRPDWVHVPLAGLMRAMGEKP